MKTNILCLKFNMQLNSVVKFWKKISKMADEMQPLCTCKN